jgi:hypothetical protein
MLTNPSTIQGIIKWVRDAIAGAVEMVSGLIGDLFEVVADLPFTDTNKWMSKANAFKSGGADSDRKRKIRSSDPSFETALKVANRIQAGFKPVESEEDEED